ncbi:hypothetical protein Syun_016462 [Stephania yunnanensis]|uniref:Uncharacterized protein n=1 Tax=Stephania yunnanensis TaxID=152371 RepID=A0AAP0J6Q1_9MAGN
MFSCLTKQRQIRSLNGLKLRCKVNYMRRILISAPQHPTQRHDAQNSKKFVVGTEVIATTPGSTPTTEKCIKMIFREFLDNFGTKFTWWYK